MRLVLSVGIIASIVFAEVTGRPVNISRSWFLPQERYPVFYRYFNDKVTWNEAEAVCDTHHADLLSVQASTQMDTARAYLKEIDVTDNVWIGLRKEAPDKPFTWTNGEKLEDGYWSDQIPKTNEKLCAAIDPVADFRWNSYYCTGPEVASFVCELPVPEWTKKDDGCMITSLPSLTITLIPEIGVVQLLSDCGLDGTRMIACKGGTNQNELIRRLSCDVDVFASTVFSKLTTDSSQQSELNQITKTYTRHRRGVNGTADTSKPHPSYVFPHSPYLASERNGPNTSRPPVKPKPLPVLIITGEKNESKADGITSEKPEIVVMLEDKDEMVPLTEDIIIHDPSMSPMEVINVDVIEMYNETSEKTTSDATEVSLNLIEEDNDANLPQRPNRGRSRKHTEHSSFYPRFLRGMLG